MARKKAFIFSEIEDYRTELEIKHLRTKNHFVLGFLLLMMILTIVYLVLSGQTLVDSIPVVIAFLAVLIMNITHLAYGRITPSFYQMNKYVTTVGTFFLSILMIFTFRSPSMVISLFIAYSIAAFYQDMKVLFLSNTFMLLTVFAIIVNNPEILGLASATLDARVGIGFFFIAFMVILSISSYIIVKQKSFFFNQIASAKESEFRQLDLLIELKEKLKEENLPSETYFSHLEAFTEAFCKKIGSANVFKEKIAVLRDLDKGISEEDLLVKYPTLTKTDLSRMEDLLMSGHHKLRKAAMKIMYDQNIHIKKREIFSETQFKSFNHQSDRLEIKIIAFVLFYTALKKGFAVLPGLEEEKIYDALIHSDFYYSMDPRIVRIYQKNSAVFDEIVKDAFKKKVRR